MLSTIANAANSAQICPKLPKVANPKSKLWNTTKNQDFSVSQKLKFLRVEEALEHVYTVRKFNLRIFHMLFLLSKMAFVCELQHIPCGNLWFSQGSTPQVGMRFCGNVPNSPRNKNLKRLISYLLDKVVVLNPKRLLSPLGGAKKTFFSTLNVMISQMVRNENIRFGKHIDI
jgi:hypothetical protein